MNDVKLTPRRAKLRLRKLEFQYAKTQESWATATGEKLEEMNERTDYLYKHIMELLVLMAKMNWYLPKPQTLEIASQRRARIKLIQNKYERAAA